MRTTYRLPVHATIGAHTPTAPDEEEGDEDRFVNRECYEFNHQLRAAWNDRRCEHCRHYLTARCQHIDEFLDDVEDLSPE